MAQQSFSLISNQQFTNANVTANGVYTLYTSSTVNNNNNLPSLRLVVDYKSENPAYLPGGITCVVESMNGGEWFPIAYQFEKFQDFNNGRQRVISLQPDMSTYNDGIDSIIYVGDATLGRISRQQGKVGSSFRVRLQLNEHDFGTAQAFQSINVSIYGELYD